MGSPTDTAADIPAHGADGAREPGARAHGETQSTGDLATGAGLVGMEEATEPLEALADIVEFTIMPTILRIVKSSDVHVCIH